MAKKLNIKDNKYEVQLTSRRIYFAGGIISFLILIIVARVFYLTVLQHEHFSTLAISNRVKVEPVPPVRGLIYSRDGLVLAENRPAFSLEVVPEQIKDADAIIIKLQELISIKQNDISRFKNILEKKRRFERIPLRFNLTEEEVALFAVNRHRFPGVDVIADLTRYYPYSEYLTHAIGYVARIDEDDIKDLDKSNYAGTTHIGKLGIEKAYESVLHGKVGYQQVEVNAQGRVIRILERTAPRPGENLYLTIDVSLQQVALGELRQRRGAIVAMDTRNGDVLVLASSPGYDPNKFVNGIDDQSYKALLSSMDKPLINRATQGEYPPASTIKPLIGLISLEQGVRNASDQYWCQGWFSLPGSQHRYRDWKKGGHGYTDLHKAITQSCDVYFYILANELGIDRIYSGLSRFGLGQLTGIDIDEEVKGLLPSRDWKRKHIGQHWFPGETMIMSIGQGYMLTTPIQLAKVTAILANRGKAVTPRLVSSISNATTGEEKMLPVTVEEVVKVNNEGYWDEIIKSMYDVVHSRDGTAWRSGLNAAYKFAGKTGTAQVISIANNKEYKKEKIADELKDHSLFIAFAPVDEPEIALAIIVENGGGGSETAAPIARKMFDHYMLEHNLIDNKER